MHRKWDSHEIPHSPGTHKVVIGEKVVTEFCGVKQYGRIYAHVAVEHAFYSGKVPIHFQGFLNAKTGGLITRRILTGVISPIAVEKGEIPGWNQIDDPSILAPSPAFTIGYFDIYFPRDGQANDVDTAWPDSRL